MSEEQENHTFETSMRQLEEIVQRLEKGDVPLEEAMELFQEGMKLSKDCHERLTKVEKQMTDVLSEDGSLSTLPEEEL
ncbi:exodeoxyribonuclease VII small subunit [Alkalicoccus urumqiensis]|uniref:Exodeoxyribonuclease 7 small subunit n=1 Tax=Alkalicoccus urumqiensis TaxID=1548213 RepID=A0A2P6MK90_ALKUR|nr:exodeoxyribonuclease VII small subunit [Alkalicoccus urumqiensis]PRO66712.1 exodeoxyribonuclease VII small subunit [Alkalicoccus urumqiensis]